MPKTWTIDMPVRFQGTEAEKRANRETHRFTRHGEDEYYCIECDCKPWHAAADYPCGTNPPREKITKVIED